ncbi:MAG: ParB/RepB/Spo0J family partition protein [Clostridiales bacterium]|nr:ParB/RepB/Spo0J family partition protein [Clostridiales bacterium]MCD7826941.1 ParB/RepB/Spo0J family partition protein [Clostridiales bacterium]
MPPKKGGLGRGFDALFIDNSTDEPADGNSIITLRLNDIEPNKNQPRQSFDDDALSELADSIREHGVLQPLIVRPLSDGSYQLVAGERRWRASRLAGLDKVPVIVRALTDSEVAVIALIENLQRENLNPIEEAEGIGRLIDEYGFTQEQAAQRLGKSRSAVTNTLRLSRLPDSVKELVADNTLTAGHGRTLLGLEDPSLIEETAKLAVQKNLSVRETEKLVKSINSAGKKSPQKKRHRDTYFDEVELSLSDYLGRKVVVKDGKNGGKIEIEYFDKEDLSHLAKIMGDD